MTDPTIRSQIRGTAGGTTGPIGQPIQNPLSNLEMDADTALYVGILEGQLAAYAINEVKYRTLLEMLTGESWNSTMVDVDTKVLVDMASQALVRRGMDGVEARTTVMRRFEHQDNTPAQPTINPIHPAAITIEDRFNDWNARRQNRIRTPSPDEVRESAIRASFPNEVERGRE